VLYCIGKYPLKVKLKNTKSLLNLENPQNYHVLNCLGKYPLEVKLTNKISPFEINKFLIKKINMNSYFLGIKKSIMPNQYT